MSNTAQHTRTATDTVIDGLHAKGYRSLVRYPTDRRGFEHQTNPTVAFTLYTNGSHVLVLQEYKDGGCELYRTVCEVLGVDNMINAIPTAPEPPAEERDDHWFAFHECPGTETIKVRTMPGFNSFRVVPIKVCAECKSFYSQV